MSETRERILETARGLFNQEGLHRVGVRDIARAVGMSPGPRGLRQLRQILSGAHDPRSTP